MNTHRITDDEAEAVLLGRAPDARPGLAPLAQAVASFRQASSEGPPRPSAELALRLDLDRVERLSATAIGMNASTPASAHLTAPMPRTRRRRVALTGIASLGLAAKIAIGAGGALAVGVGGAGAAGAIGALPAPAQEVFNQVTGHPGGEHVSDTGIENSEFGIETAENARTKGEEQRQAALENAEERRSAGLENAEEHADLPEAAVDGQQGHDTAVDAPQGAGDVADEKSATGQENAEDAPGADKH